jgi:AcrR family transcriptional regulator
MGDVLDAALRCIARWGVAKTTLEDVAREAGSSRATVYRSFPGGKDAVLAALADRELVRLQDAVAAAVTGVGEDSLEDAIVAAVTSIARHLEDHAAFQFLLAHEPGLVLPHLAFRELDALLARVRAFGGPLLAPHLGGDTGEAAVAAEWVARIVVSYTACPADGVRLTDAESVRKLVRAFVLPGFLIPA